MLQLESCEGKLQPFAQWCRHQPHTITIRWVSRRIAGRINCSIRCNWQFAAANYPEKKRLNHFFVLIHICQENASNVTWVYGGPHHLESLSGIRMIGSEPNIQCVVSGYKKSVRECLFAAVTTFNTS